MKRIISACLLSLLLLHLPSWHKPGCTVSTADAAESDNRKRVALVIGNSAYANAPLKNPVNDAKDIAAKLRILGFIVVERNNLKTRQIGGTLREFRSKLEPGAVALVFYAGHGLQIKGDNYLPAVDADINSEEDVPNQSLAMKQIMDVLDESKTRLNLIFLDACRNNPYASGFRSAERGLARVSAPSGTLISYATKPGSVAADGAGRNGLYTSKLLAQMDSTIQIEQTLKRVVTEVKAASKGKQEPWMEGSIEGDFCFGGCTAHDSHLSAVPTTAAGFDPETESWGIVKETSDVEVVRDFLKEYPQGKYAGPARLKLKELEGRAKVAIAVRPQEPLQKNTAGARVSDTAMTPDYWQLQGEWKDKDSRSRALRITTDNGQISVYCWDTQDSEVTQVSNIVWDGTSLQMVMFTPSTGYKNNVVVRFAGPNELRGTSSGSWNGTVTWTKLSSKH